MAAIGVAFTLFENARHVNDSIWPWPTVLGLIVLGLLGPALAWLSLRWAIGTAEAYLNSEAQLARRNAELNRASNLELREANVFDQLRELERAGERFDTVCLDPPAFAKNRGAVSSARSGYKEINLRAMKLLRPEGILVTSSCSYHLSESDFAEVIVDAARDAHRYVQVLEKRGQALGHPVLAGVPETSYLKCLILRVL